MSLCAKKAEIFSDFFLALKCVRYAYITLCLFRKKEELSLLSPSVCSFSFTEDGRKGGGKAGVSEIPCRVCSAPSSGFHFGALTCEGCKVGFKF